MSIQLKQEDSFAFAELLELLSYMDEKDTNKIPKKLMNLFKTYASSDYKKHIDPTVPMEEQKLSSKTISYLGILCINYWCENEEEKKSLLDAAYQNDLKREEELRQKYSYENIFNNKKTTSEGFSFGDALTEQTSNISNLPIDYNTLPLYKKMFIKIKNFFYKLFNKANNPT